MTGNSTGKAPAWRTPRFTAWASPRRWTLQLTSSLQLLQMPMTGRPRKAVFVTPVDFSQERCRKPSRSLRSNHSLDRSNSLARSADHERLHDKRADDQQAVDHLGEQHGTADQHD